MFLPAAPSSSCSDARLSLRSCSVCFEAPLRFRMRGAHLWWSLPCDIVPSELLTALVIRALTLPQNWHSGTPSEKNSAVVRWLAGT
ncbi:hypothetical protein VUR80DRAFT_7241 [Thermomyces stellatus]